jgi:protein-arginine kinase activator protein McsA
MQTDHHLIKGELEFTATQEMSEETTTTAQRTVTITMTLQQQARASRVGSKTAFATANRRPNAPHTNTDTHRPRP